jgi:hypothetical protein
MNTPPDTIAGPHRRKRANTCEGASHRRAQKSFKIAAPEGTKRRFSYRSAPEKIAAQAKLACAAI